MPLHSPRCRAAGLAARLAVGSVLFAVVLLPAAQALAAEPGVSIDGPWIRLIIPSRPAAGYFVLTNSAATPRTLTGAVSPACGAVMLHRTVSNGGVEQMQMVTSIPLPAQGSVAFSPGGYHLMCMSPAPSLKHGAAVPVTLSFADGGSLTAAFPVRNALGK